MTKVEFHRFMADPNTPALLTRLLADETPIDPPERCAARYVVQHQDGTYWAGGNRWVGSPLVARWFELESAANAAALIELPDPISAWRVVPLDLEAATGVSQATPDEVYERR